MNEELKAKEKRRTYAMWCVIAICVGSMMAIYWRYITIAKSTVPIMDFWHWIAIYGEKVQNGIITFSDYFYSDKGQHIQPLPMAIQFTILKWSHFDVQPLVVWGLFVRLLLVVGMVVLFWRAYKESITTNRVFFALICILMTGCIINYNQWELTTEPFSFGNSLRVLLYYASFAWAALFVVNISKRSLYGNLLRGGFLGVLCAFLTIFCGAAYFVGHLPAIGIAFILVLLKDKKHFKKYMLPLALWFVISLFGAIIYYWLYTRGGRADVVASSNGVILFTRIITAEMLFWGSSILPEKLLSTVGQGPFYVCGTLMFAYIVWLIVKQVKTKQTKRNLFPLICVIYAVIISMAIAFGRVEVFGDSVMCSSRYVVESSIGLLGIVWLTYEQYHADGSEKIAISNVVRSTYGVGIAVALFFVGGLTISAISEMRIAPYRGAYNESIKEIMLNIDERSDEELAVTQGEASDVRVSVAFLKRYNLSIFADKEEH